MRNLALVALVALVAACPGRPPADPTHAVAGPRPCEATADHLVSLMQPADADGKPVERDPATVDRITRVIAQRCTADRWTADAQRCFGKLASLEAADGCAPLLTVEQREAMDKAIDAAFAPP